MYSLVMTIRLFKTSEYVKMQNMRRHCEKHTSVILELTLISSNLNNFHSLEVVSRVSETQIQVSENSNSITWRLKRAGQVF